MTTSGYNRDVSTAVASVYRQIRTFTNVMESYVLDVREVTLRETVYKLFDDHDVSEFTRQLREKVMLVIPTIDNVSVTRGLNAKNGYVLHITIEFTSTSNAE